MLGRKEKERKKVNFIWYLMRSEINRVRNNYREGLEAFCILQLNVDLNTFNRYRERHKCVCIYVYGIYIYIRIRTCVCISYASGQLKAEVVQQADTDYSF